MNRHSIVKLIIIPACLFCLFTSAQGLLAFGNDGSELLQIEKFASNLQESIENGNPGYFNNSFDNDAFLKKIMSGNSSSVDSEFNKGFREGFLNNFDLGSMLVANIKQKNGTYQFLRAYKENNSYILLFRLLNNEGINYHEFEVKSENGKFGITDAFLFTSGEKMSETLARVYNSFRMVNSNPGSDTLIYLQAVSDLGKIQEIASHGKYNQAYKKWQKLPSAFQGDRIYLITGIRIASHLNDKIYLKTYKQYISCFPDNTAKYLIPLDGLMLQKNYIMALACIDSLDKNLNKDPMLNYLRGTLLYEMGNHTEAVSKMSMLIDQLPDFETGYYTLLSLYVKDKNYTQATLLLDKILMAFNYYKDDFASVLQEYPEFINSKEYKSWINQ